MTRYFARSPHNVVTGHEVLVRTCEPRSRVLLQNSRRTSCTTGVDILLVIRLSVRSASIRPHIIIAPASRAPRRPTASATEVAGHGPCFGARAGRVDVSARRDARRRRRDGRATRWAMTSRERPRDASRGARRARARARGMTVGTPRRRRRRRARMREINGTNDG